MICVGLKTIHAIHQPRAMFAISDSVETVTSCVPSSWSCKQGKISIPLLIAFLFVCGQGCYKCHFRWSMKNYGIALSGNPVDNLLNIRPCSTKQSSIALQALYLHRYALPAKIACHSKSFFTAQNCHIRRSKDWSAHHIREAHAIFLLHLCNAGRASISSCLCSNFPYRPIRVRHS